MATLIERLLRQSHLFDDPAAYEAGVRDTLELLEHAGAGRADDVPARGPVTRTA